jgi:hypothetical protein
MGPDFAYRYDLSVQNLGVETLIVVPTNGGGAGPYSAAYLVPADGAIWHTWGEALGDAGALVLILNLSCQVVHSVNIPSGDQSNAPQAPAYLMAVDKVTATASQVPRSGQEPGREAETSDFVKRCPRTTPPMWTT